jgi:hypothetical protein
MSGGHSLNSAPFSVVGTSFFERFVHRTVRGLCGQYRVGHAPDEVGVDPRTHQIGDERLVNHAARLGMNGAPRNGFPLNATA